MNGVRKFPLPAVEVPVVDVPVRAHEIDAGKVAVVDVTIDGQDERLKPGMSAQCKIITRNIDGVLSVPLEAVFEKEDTTLVYVKNGGFDRRPVRLGAKNSDFIIIEDGLKAGEEVALRDPTIPLEDLGVQKGSEGGKSNGQKPAASPEL